MALLVLDSVKMNGLFLFEEENIWWRFDDCFMVTGVVELVYLTSIYFTFPNNCCNCGGEHHLAVHCGTLWTIGQTCVVTNCVKIVEIVQYTVLHLNTEWKNNNCSTKQH